MRVCWTLVSLETIPHRITPSMIPCHFQFCIFNFSFRIPPLVATGVPADFVSRNRQALSRVSPEVRSHVDGRPNSGAFGDNIAGVLAVGRVIFESPACRAAAIAAVRFALFEAYAVDRSL